MSHSRPSLLVSTSVVFAIAALWIYLRLFVFPHSLLPITFVLPLMVCVWTGRRWQIWALAGAFTVKTLVRAYWFQSAGILSFEDDLVHTLGVLFNIVVGALAVQAILSLRERLEDHNAMISTQNAALEAQSAELSQQNEEIKAQAEELAEQNEEIESQSEEVSRQNEELVELAERLAGREKMLQGLLRATREIDSGPQTLGELCRGALSAIGHPAAAIAILERRGDVLDVLAQESAAGMQTLPAEWPVEDSIAGVVLREERTAYVSDLSQRPDLRKPLEGIAGSVLATPLQLGGESLGLLVACSREAAHWTDEQFRVTEWIAAQCGLVLEALRGQHALARHAEALEAANRSKDRFLAMLSHELRTPLTPAMAAAGALENHASLPDEVREDIRMIRRNIGIQSRLIDDLLDLTRISRGKVELDRQVLRIGPLLNDVRGIVSGDLDVKSQQLRLDLDEVDGHAVLGDGSRLQQVFWNLLKNAIKFSPPGAEVEMRARAEGGRIVVEVRDSGIGIPPEEMERIFMPFEQVLDASRKAADGGLGLGLAIAKAIVELHDGTISAHSDGPGRGAMFVVDLPVTAVDLAATGGQPAVPQDGARPGRSLRILLVEDHEDTRMIVARLLQGFGHAVDQAGTAREAFDMFTERDFDLVISDLGLPDESGIELMKRLRAARSNVRGICLSGYGMDGDVAACKEAGFREHLTKPIDITRLQAAIVRAASAESAEADR